MNRIRRNEAVTVHIAYWLEKKEKETDIICYAFLSFQII